MWSWDTQKTVGSSVCQFSIMVGAQAAHTRPGGTQWHLLQPWGSSAGDISLLLAEILAQAAYNAHPLKGKQCCLQGEISFCIWAAPVLHVKMHPWKASKLQMLVKTKWGQMLCHGGKCWQFLCHLGPCVFPGVDFSRSLGAEWRRFNPFPDWSWLVWHSYWFVPVEVKATCQLLLPVWWRKTFA